MTQRQFIIGGLALAIAVALFVFVTTRNGSDASSLVTAQRARQGKTSPSLSPSVSPSLTPTLSPGVTPTLSPSLSPSPSAPSDAKFESSGSTVRIFQGWWTKRTANTTAQAYESLTSKSDIGPCLKKKYAEPKSVDLTEYADSKGLAVSKTQLAGRPLIDNNYLISKPLTSKDAATSRWINLTIGFRNPKKLTEKTLKFYYRVSDSAGTLDAKASDWIEVPNPTDNPSTECNGNIYLASYQLDRVGKFFQYKVNLGAGQQVANVWVDVEPGKTVAPSPSPTLAPSASPTATASAGAGTGKLLIAARRILPSTATPVSPSPSVALPDATATPTATPAASDPCVDATETEELAEIKLNLRQTVGGSVKIDDQVTDGNGQWQGLDGEIDEFKVGTYTVTYGEYAPNDYKLVAFCVEPNDGLHHVKTQTIVSTRKATLLVKSGVTTKLTALYGLKTKPYVVLNKFAVDATGKVIRVIYPGQSFRYLIRYENTSEGTAKNVVIKDVIPAQFGLADSYLDSTENLQATTDSQGRTVLSYTIGDLAKGQKGSLTIPVSLRADAFGSPDQIGSYLSANQPPNPLTTQTSPAPTASGKLQ